jgi:hypothetical protein
MFISGSKTFYAFLNFSEETYAKKTENGLRSGLIAIKFCMQIFSRIWIGFFGVDSNQAKKFRARPDADPQPCPLEQVHILGTGKKISGKLEEIEKQYGVLTSQIIIPLTIISTCRSPGISVGDP